jgi:hypothetical protein
MLRAFQRVRMATDWIRSSLKSTPTIDPVTSTESSPRRQTIPRVGDDARWLIWMDHTGGNDYYIALALDGKVVWAGTAVAFRSLIRERIK